MNRKKLAKIKREAKAMYASPQGRSSADCIKLAKSLGRTLVKRGSEPNWVRVGAPVLSPPLSIPNHPKDMPIGTLRSVVDQLLDDCDEWLIYLDQQDEK